MVLITYSLQNCPELVCLLRERKIEYTHNQLFAFTIKETDMVLHFADIMNLCDALYGNCNKCSCYASLLHYEDKLLCIQCYNKGVV